MADRPPGWGRHRRREFEYRRDGTASLVAALAVHSGEVLAKVISRNDSVTFCDFLDDIDRVVPKDRKIVLIMDNGSSHVSKRTRGRNWIMPGPSAARPLTLPLVTRTWALGPVVPAAGLSTGVPLRRG